MRLGKGGCDDDGLPELFAALFAFELFNFCGWILRHKCRLSGDLYLCLQTGMDSTRRWTVRLINNGDRSLKVGHCQEFAVSFWL